MVRKKIIKALQDITGQKDIKLEVPEIAEYGDYATNVAMVMFGKKEKILRCAQDDKSDSKIVSHLSSAKGPRELAERIVVELNSFFGCI